MSAERGRPPAAPPQRRGRRSAARPRSAAERLVATSEAFGISTGRRAAVLALVVCALALTVAVPLRNYVSQRQELAAVQAEQDRLAAQVADLSQRRQELSDPAEVAASARSRLGYVRPGETPFVVQLPGDERTPADAEPPVDPEWYHRLWGELRGERP